MTSKFVGDAVAKMMILEEAVLKYSYASSSPEEVQIFNFRLNAYSICYLCEESKELKMKWGFGWG
jgi:hypothetical protein